MAPYSPWEEGSSFFWLDHEHVTLVHSSSTQVGAPAPSSFSWPLYLSPLWTSVLYQAGLLCDLTSPLWGSFSLCECVLVPVFLSSLATPILFDSYWVLFLLTLLSMWAQAVSSCYALTASFPKRLNLQNIPYRTTDICRLTILFSHLENAKPQKLESN